MIIIVGLILAFILIVVFSNRRTRYCRWRADRRGERDGEQRYKCMACGAVAFTSDGAAPNVCHDPRRRT